MDLTTLSLFLGGFVLFLVYCLKSSNFWGKHGIPTAAGRVPLVGNMLNVLLLKLSYSELCRKIHEESKGRSMVGLYNMRTPALLIREPELVKTVMQTDFASFHHNALELDAELDPLISKNPFFIYGDEWTVGRKRLTYAFSSMRLKILFETVLGVCRKFEDFLERKVAKSNGKYEVEMKELMSRFTAEVVANAGLGVEGFSFVDEPHSSTFYSMGKGIVNPTLLTGITQALIFFMPQLNKIFRMRFVPKNIDEFFRRIVTEVLGNRRRETVPRKDFFQLMVDLEKIQGETFDEESVAAHVFSFFLDGFESSSITLNFVGYQLARHPDIQQKLRDEVRSVLARHDGVITYESLNEMPYLDQVLNESQRMYPALGTLGKVCTQEFELRGSDGLSCRVKPGTQILISNHGLQMDPDYWTNPEIFDPDRFGTDKKREMEKFAFLPFGAGPRMCVGMRMAVVQMKACLVSLVNKYNLELLPKTQLPLKISAHHFLTSPVGGIWVKITNH